MSHSIPQQHPAVVLRSRYALVRGLLLVAVLAVLSLTVAVVALALDDGATTPATAGVSAPAATAPTTTRFDGGPEEGTRGVTGGRTMPVARFDGGPDEGTRGAGH